MNMELTKEKASEWIDKETNPLIKDIKRKIIANVTYVSAITFKIKLRTATDIAFQKIVGDYAVLYDYKPHSSKRWVFHQIKRALPKKPSLISHYTKSADHVIGVADEIYQKNIQNIIVFDDAAYSGEQLINRILVPLSNFFTEKMRNIKFFIIVPYATTQSQQRIKAIPHSPFVEIHFILIETMKTLLEILSKSEQEVLQKSEREEFAYLGATLTFFDHRVADDHSFFAEVEKLITKSPKPYSADTTYGKKEKAEWQLYWSKFLNFLNKED
jgi:hypothetical protein